MPDKKPDNIYIFFACVLIPNAGGWIGATLARDRDWFENDVQHPVWRPPNWLFPVVWVLVYSLMGIASYYVFKHGEGVSKFWLPLIVYGVQLIVNWFWTPIFFIWRQILGALIDLAVLWVLVVITIVLFWRVKRKSALLMAPYIIWITIALALNANYYQLNKEDL